MQTTLSRRRMLGTALAAAGAAAATTVGTGGRAHASALRPQGTAPEPSPTLDFHLLPTPYRVYDSRSGQTPDGTDSNTGASDTALTLDETRTIDVSYALGKAANDSGVPTDSWGVLMNVTLVNTAASRGYLKVWAHESAEPNASSLNWDRVNAIVANAVTSACQDGYIDIKCGGITGSATHVIIDVVGYYDHTIMM